MYRRVDVLLEGRDDKRFFDAVVRPILEERYDYVQTWEYAGASIEKRIGYLRSIQAMNADYLFVSDINTSPCITERKDHLLDSHRRMIDASRMIIVVREIESWYLAGLDGDAGRELGVPSPADAGEVTKEEFRRVMPERFNNSVVDFMTEVLKRFRVATAKVKNRSFCYLMDKLEAESRRA